MKAPSYNLLDEPWMPVRLKNGQTVHLGLLDVFRRSEEIVALADTSPASLVAHYRLLVAIFRRALYRDWPQGWSIEDEADWYENGLPLPLVVDYLEHWRERFWLFHPEHPFMQVAALAFAPETCDKVKPWTQVSLASASGNTPLVFDHSCDDIPSEVAPGVALTHLLGFLQFTPGGLVKTIRASDKSGPLANTAALIPLGDTLARTLLLCLPPFVAAQAEHDLPAWEQQAPSVADLLRAPTIAAGPNDRYTRQTRAVLLLLEESGGVRWIRFAAGVALEEDDSAPDPMASYRPGSNGLVRLTFTQGRAVWRDLPTLLPNPVGKSRAAATLLHALSLHEELDGAVPVYQPLLVAGLASDQAKLERWRAEQLVLPSVLLHDVDKLQFLGELLERAERFFFDLRGLGALMLASALPDPDNKDTRSRARSMLDNSPFSATYFSAAELAMPELLGLLAETRISEADHAWSTALRQAARDAWDLLLEGMGKSGKVLLAVAPFYPLFVGLLNKQLPITEPSAEDAI
ncbi:MAG: type I-E CRISPR-associated protein Cse1/CasA [Burkholderiaceae bacterium]